jgi:hypothetical protein
MSEQRQLKELLYDVLERKNKTMNTIFNDSNQHYVKQLKTTIEQLRITEENFEITVTAIVKMVLEESKNNGYIASVLIFSMELDAYLTKNSSLWYKRCMLIEILIPLLCKRSKNQLCCKYLFIFIISSIVILLIKS